MATVTVSDGQPAWMTALEDEDWGFIKRFVLASGSLKDIAEQYSISYPTVRARLDRLIAKIKAADRPASKDPFEQRIRILVADGKLPVAMAKELISAHREALKKRSK